jgi:hypothetical protein
MKWSAPLATILLLLALAACAGPSGAGDAPIDVEPSVAAPPEPACTEQMGASVTGGSPEQFDPTGDQLPAELAPALDAGVTWTCAVRVDYVTDDDSHLVDYQLYYVSYDGSTPVADLKAAFDASLLAQGYTTSVGSFSATEDQMDQSTGELKPDVDPLDLTAFSLNWLLGTPNAVYPATTTTTVSLEFGGGGYWGLPEGPGYGDDFRGEVTRVGYLLRVPYASNN